MMTVYEHAGTIPDSRTAELLELLAHQQLLTPAEIGVELGNGQPRRRPRGGPVICNLSRMEGHLLEQERISRWVLVKDFTGCETEESASRVANRTPGPPEKRCADAKGHAPSGRVTLRTRGKSWGLAAFRIRRALRLGPPPTRRRS